MKAAETAQKRIEALMMNLRSPGVPALRSAAAVP